MQKVMKSNVLLPLIEDSYRTEYTEWDRKNLRFSDAGIACESGEKCERQIYYDIYSGDQKTLLTSGSLVLFDDGRLHESDIRRRLRMILRSPEREVDDPEVGARGKIDNTIYWGQIKDAINQLLVDSGMQPLDIKDDPGLEIKSVNQFQFQEMADSGVILQSYYDQIQYYLWVTRKAFFICIIKNRNSMGPEKGVMPYLEFIVQPDPERQAALRAGMKTTKEAIDKNILPPRPFLRDSTQCQFCRFKFVCWPEQEPIQGFQGKVEGIEEPTKELLESAIRLYNSTNKQLADLEKQKDEAKSVIERYFKSRGFGEIMVDNIKAMYLPQLRTTPDLEYLKANLTKEQLIDISEPKEALLEKLVQDRKVDALVLDRGFQSKQNGGRLYIKELKIKESNRQAVVEEKPKTPPVIKEEVKNDKGSKRGKKVSKARKPKAGVKGSSPRKGKRNKAKRS